MTAKSRWVGVVFMLSLVLGWVPTFAQESTQPPDERRYYPQRGHWVMGEFLEVYQSVPNPAEIHGYPITEAFQEQTLGRIVQYFEKARFELIPENPPVISIRLLGRNFHYPQISPPVVSSRRPKSRSAMRFWNTLKPMAVQLNLVIPSPTSRLKTG